MNAGLAKPIHANWFMHARAVDLHQSLAAALFWPFAVMVARPSASTRQRPELLRRTIEIF
ncbi:hypothetical protein ACH79_13785 [Bradyrhizobium sp. CCBAU 051011]|jgi:hypothetical protein|nr:hypothetical protein ACH79_13785 [Bradyrhizobium sp. CCBAU 051011]